MDLEQRFRTLLQSSVDGFSWAVEQVPSQRRYLGPPEPLGEWSLARHVFHMLYYEQTIALPSMRQWLGGACPPYDDDAEDAAWGDGGDLATLLGQFKAVHDEQIALIPHFAPGMWEEIRDAIWGPVTLRWVITKTYQHTCEHTHDVLRLALVWDVYLARQQASEGA